MTKLIDCAETLIQRLAPELGRVYVVSARALPPELCPGRVEGFTAPGLAFMLRPYLERMRRWRGRAWAIIVALRVVRRTLPRHSRAARRRALKLALLGTVLHETAHLFEFGELPQPSEALIQRAIAEFRGELDIILPADDPRLPPWCHHRPRFIRAALHLSHRARAFEPRLCDFHVVQTIDYGLSGTWKYAAALGDEPERLQHVPIRDVLATSPPAAFTELWTNDTRERHE